MKVGEEKNICIYIKKKKKVQLELSPDNCQIASHPPLSILCNDKSSNVNANTR